MQATHRRLLTPLTAALALVLLAPTGSALAAPSGETTIAEARAADQIALARDDRGDRRDRKYDRHYRGDRRDRHDRYDRRDRYDRHDRHQRYYRNEGRYRHHGQYRHHGGYRDSHHRHFTIPRLIHHHDHYRDYYYGRVYHRSHRHYHAVYSFPVYVDGYLEHRPYAYCGADYFGTGYFGVDGPRFSLRIGF